MRELTASQWRRVETVFEKAAELDTGPRIRFLELSCADDTAVRREVETMLGLRARASSYMEEPLLNVRGREAFTEGSRIGPYRLVRRIGAGGMGSVWLAERDDEHFNKQVAVKLIKRGMDTDDILLRFRHERQILANLEHPGIARLLDGGATDDGLPYLVMEYVDGVPIDRHCDERGLDLTERIELFTSVCAAVEHAHRNLVVHRDLKPGNILVERGTENPKLLDFGIAKVLGVEGSASTLAATVTEARLLTPRYASPEQVRGGPITTATDVYSLGVVLYELLTGRQPYAPSVRTRSELEHAVCEHEPRRPSTAVLDVEGAPDARRLSQRLAGDLDTIVLKALRKEPVRRYESVERLADDLRRHLGGLPVLARPDTFVYRTGKFVRRHAVSVTAAAVIAVALVSATIVTGFMYARSERARELATWQSYVANVVAANAALMERHDNVDARTRLELAAPELRGWEWAHLESRLDRSLWSADTGGRTFAVAFSPDQRLVASGAGIGLRGHVRLFDLRSGALVHSFDDLPGWVWDVAFSQDGGTLAAAGGDGTVRLFDTATGRATSSFGGHDGSVGAIAFSPDGRFLVTAEGSKTSLDSSESSALHVWSVETAELRARLEGHLGGVWDLTFSADGAQLASASTDRTVRVWDTATWSARGVLAGHEDVVTSVAFSLDGSELVAGALDGNVIRWDLASESLLDTFLAPGAGTVCFAIDAESMRALSASRATDGGDNSVVLWDLVSGTVESRLLGHDYPGGVWDIAWSGDRSRIATGAWELSLRVWTDSGCPPTQMLEHPGVERLAVSRDGAVLASADPEGTIRLWEARSGRNFRTLEGPEALTSIALGPAGRWIAASGSGGASVWSVGRAGGERVLAGTEGVRVVAFGPAGRWLATGAENGAIALHDLDELHSSRDLPGHGTAVHALAFSPDGSRLASGSGSPARDETLDRSVRIWDVATGRELVVMHDVAQWVTGLVFSPDGSRLFAVGRDNRIRQWDVATGRELAQVHNRGGGYMLHDVAISPDGERLATAAAAQDVRIWDTARLEPILALRGHRSGQVRAVAFDPQGRWLASAGGDGTVRLWDTSRPGERLSAEVPR